MIQSHTSEPELIVKVLENGQVVHTEKIALPFKNTDGSKVLIVLNNNAGTQTFNIKFNSKIVTTTLSNGAVATYVWK